MQYINGIPVFGESEQNTLDQMTNCARIADRVALMGDNHLGYAVPIGGVVAFKGKISPSGVGYDIACGNKAVRLDIPGDELRKNIGHWMDEIFKTISFGVGRKNNERVEHELFDTHTGWATQAAKPLKEKAVAQLGTIGSGNHYVDLFVDENGDSWIGVHFGSRGLGHGIATWFLKAAGASDGMMVDPCVIDVDSDLGAQYIEAMKLGGAYAYAGRDWVCSRVAKLLGANIVEEVHSHHNFAWEEEHEGEKLWVVRKGATPAAVGQKGFVGASMCEPAVIIQGADSNDPEIVALQKAAMYSTVHGAGRVMGRKEATGTFDKKTGEVKRAPKVTEEMWRNSINLAGVAVRGGGVDESPFVYKRLNEVLAHQGGTIDILHTLTPIGVAMAGSKEFDPYKD